jgi:hypothetical protein
MSEDTSFISKPNGSSIFGVSVRGWLALLLTATVCAICTAQGVFISLGWTSTTITIPEPLYSGFMTALGFYLGQGLNKKTG